MKYDKQSNMMLKTFSLKKIFSEVLQIRNYNSLKTKMYLPVEIYIRQLYIYIIWITFQYSEKKISEYLALKRIKALFVKGQNEFIKKWCTSYFKFESLSIFLSFKF